MERKHRRVFGNNFLEFDLHKLRDIDELVIFFAILDKNVFLFKKMNNFAVAISHAWINLNLEFFFR